VEGVIAAEQCYAKLDVLVPRFAVSDFPTSLELRCGTVCWLDNPGVVKESKLVSVFVCDVVVCDVVVPFFGKAKELRIETKTMKVAFKVVNEEATSSWLLHFQVLLSLFSLRESTYF